MSKPDPDEPRGEAEILPFRKRPRDTPKTVRSAPASTDGDSIEPLSTGALVKIGLLVLFLVAGGVWLMNKMRDIGRLEDCALQGRRNCVTIPVPERNQ